MGCGTIVHYLGAFLLLAATAMLIVVDVSAPVVDDIALLKVQLGSAGRSSINFGTFGYCVVSQSGGNDCSKVQIGYNAAAVVERMDQNVEIGSAATNTVKALTHVMVLHPVATGLSFLAFILCVIPNSVGSLFASLLSVLAFVVILVALICDVVALQIIRNEVNDSNTSRARWSTGIWLVAVSAICNLAASIMVFFSCCASRVHRRRQDRKMAKYTHG